MSSRRHHHAAPASSNGPPPPKTLGSFPSSSAASAASAGPSPTHAAALASLPLTGSSFFPLLSDPAALHNEKERQYYSAEDHKISLTLAQMDRCQELTDSMLGILDSFDEKLGALESSMLPIHKGTQALMTAQRNIDATLAETDKIILHYRIATESESSIESHLLNAIDYVSYLEWVERIHLSINFFTKNKDKLDRGSSSGAGADGLSSSSASASSGAANLGGHSSDVDKYLRKLKDLNKRVMLECEGEFERVLGASSKNPLDLTRTGWPLPTTMIVEGAANQSSNASASPTSAAVASNAAAAGSAAGGAQLIPFQLVPALSVRELSALATRMTMAGNHNYFGILLAQRSGFLRATLKKVFNEELKFLTNQQNQAAAGSSAAAGGSAGAVAAAAAAQPPMLMQMRGSIIHASSAGGGGGLLGPSDSLLGPSASAASSAAGAPSGGSSHLYQKRSHKSVFYLEFFLKLLELEHSFLVQVLAHIFNEEELAANGLPHQGTSGGSTAGQAQESMLVQGALGGKSNLSSHTSSAISGSSLLKDLATQASTGNLTVFWGQEAYDQLYANIVESPLEYFRKKIDQNTYLKGESIMGMAGRSITSVFHIGSGANSGGGAQGAGASGGGAGGGTKSGVGGVGGDSGAGAASSFTSLTSNSSLPLGTTLSNKILILLDVLEQLNTLLPRYRILLKKHAHFEKMVEFQTSITTLARKSLQEYREYMIEYTERTAGSNKGGPALKDGTIYTLTVETLNFIKRLYEYRRVIDATPTLLDKHHHTNAAAAEKGGGGVAEPKASSDSLLSDGSFPSLASFASESTMAAVTAFLLSGLESNMESKSKGYKHGSLSAIFLLNNFHYVTKFIKKNAGTFAPGALSGGIGSIGGIGGSSAAPAGGIKSGMFLFLDRYERLVHLAMKSYRTASWEKVVTTALEASDIQDLYRSYASTPASSSAHKSARKSIKAKFAAFNSHFEEMFNAQRHYAIPDSDLRSQLRNDNVELILPSYKLLYTTFVGVEFSTNPAKYTKYTPAVLEAMLNKFFDEESG